MKRKIAVILALVAVALTACADSLTSFWSLSISYDKRTYSGDAVARVAGTFGGETEFTYGASTSSAQIDAVYAVRGTVSSASAITYDLRSLTDSTGEALSFSKVKTIGVKNVSTSDPISLGGTWMAGQTIAPSGIFLHSSPLAGIAVASGSSAVTVSTTADSVEYDLLILGIKN